VTPSRKVTPSPVAAQQWCKGSDLQDRVGEEEADSLRLLVAVSACGAFVDAPLVGGDRPR